MKYWLVLIYFLSAHCFAEIYMQNDQSGNVSYSDMPSKNATPIEITVPTKNPEPPPPEQPKKEVVVDIKKSYHVFQIVSPKDQETIQNQPILPIDIKVEPQLAEGDKIQIYVDDKAVGKPEATTKFNLNRLIRGTHQIYAVIVDKEKRNIRQSYVITIYIHQAHAATPLVRTPQ